MNFLTSQYELEIIGRIGFEVVGWNLASVDSEVCHIGRLALVKANLDDSRTSVGEINANWRHDEWWKARTSWVGWILGLSLWLKASFYTSLYRHMTLQVWHKIMQNTRTKTFPYLWKSGINASMRTYDHFQTHFLGLPDIAALRLA